MISTWYSIIGCSVCCFAACIWQAIQAKKLISYVMSIICPRRAEMPFITSNSVVLLTGATCPKGMGIHMAREYHNRVKECCNKDQTKRLILVGYESFEDVIQPLEESDKYMFKHHTTLYLQINLSHKDCGVKLENSLRRANISHIDIVIQLAGMGWVGPMFKQTEENIRNIVNLNLRAPILCARSLLPFLHIKRQEEGQGGSISKTKKMIFISSIKSQSATPFYAVYTATKAALDQFAWSLHTEFFDSNVAIQLLHPGATKTSFHKNSGVPEGAFDTSQFATSSQMGHGLVKAIDLNGISNWRSVFGTLQERLQFFVAWLVPQWTIRAWKEIGGFYLTRLSAGSDDAFRCLVTGGSAGIGRALARHLSCIQEDCTTHVVSCSRSELPPGELPQNELTRHRVLDLGVDHGLQQSATALLADVFDDHPVNLLVNNVGVNWSGRLSYLEEDQIEQMLRVNVIAPIILTNACVEHNSTRGDMMPSICFISSMSHYFSYPGSSVYGACKDALTSYAKSVGYELCANVASPPVVLTVFPGPIDTSQARNNAPSLNKEDEAKHRSSRMPPATLAALIWKSLMKGEVILQPGKMTRKFAKKAVLDPLWGQTLMRNTQLIPLVTKHKAMNNGDAGL